MILKNKRKHNLEKSDLLLYHLYNLGNPLFVYFNIISDTKLCKNIVNK